MIYFYENEFDSKYHDFSLICKMLIRLGCFSALTSREGNSDACQGRSRLERPIPLFPFRQPPLEVLYPVADRVEDPNDAALTLYNDLELSDDHLSACVQS